MRKLRCGMWLLLLAVLQGACNSEEGRALCEAIEAEDLEAVEALIAEGANVNESVRFRGSTTRPLRVALTNLSIPSERREAIAIAAIQAGGDPDLSWSYGGSSEGSSGYAMYAIIFPARSGSVRTIEALIEAGAQIGGPTGGEALLAAAAANQVEVLRVLTAAGANVNYKDRSGDTPLGAAVEAGAKEAISFLDELNASEW